MKLELRGNCRKTLLLLTLFLVFLAPHGAKARDCCFTSRSTHGVRKEEEFLGSFLDPACYAGIPFALGTLDWVNFEKTDV
mmetsp:Transcript_8705/g.15999  ORF Transcript_8705/g.15999 Transcript_8705/m.15999 type:complete len:80 (-) Transcript_8705:78-317(-)